MATTWFTSDFHLGHDLVARLRGFETVEDHDRTVLANLRATLAPGDTLWVLGDISSGWDPHEEAALATLRDLFHPLRHNQPDPLRVHLISGNHDSSHPLHPESHERQRAFLTVFDSVQQSQVMVWREHDVWLSHFPRPGYEHDGMNSRHDELRLQVPLLVHGHLHAPVPVNAPGMVDVGLDAWNLTPVEQSTVEHTLFTSAAPE